MASTYTGKLRFTLPATGELSGTWGQVVNDQITQLVEDSLAGFVSVSANEGTITLTANDGATDQTRMSRIAITGTYTSAVGVVAPSISKWWLVENKGSGAFDVNFRLAGGSGFNVPPDSRVYLVVSDATSVRPVGAGFAVSVTAGSDSKVFAVAIS